MMRVLKIHGNYNDSLKYYNKALEITPNYSKAWTKKAIVSLRLQKYDEMKEAYKKALKINPDDYIAYGLMTRYEKQTSSGSNSIPSLNAVPATVNPPTYHDCPGIFGCGNKCCGPNEGCCHTVNGPVCYDPYTQICTNI